MGWGRRGGWEGKGCLHSMTWPRYICMYMYLLVLVQIHNVKCGEAYLHSNGRVDIGGKKGWEGGGGLGEGVLIYNLISTL